jgi:ketosteroid isomerase-like protein
LRRRLLPLLALLSACTPGGSSKKAFATDVKAETELLAADRSFAHDTAQRGIEGWVDGFTDDGVMLPPGKPIVKGKGEIREEMSTLLTDPGTHLDWEPEHAAVSASGDLGYTLGHTAVTKTLPNGTELVLGKLKYMTVWKRQADGHWKAAATVGTAEP